MAKSKKKSILKIRKLLLLVALICLLSIIYLYVSSRDKDTESISKKIVSKNRELYEEIYITDDNMFQLLIEEKLYELLYREKINLSDVNIHKSNSSNNGTINTWIIRTDKNIQPLTIKIEEIFKKDNFNTIRKTTGENTTKLQFQNRDIVYNIELLSDLKQVSPNVRSYSMKPSIAIIIDDLGENMEVLTEIVNLSSYPLTVSILPGRRFTEISAEIAYQHGIEVMIHQPMEPRNNERFPPDEACINVQMTESNIKKTIDKNVKSVPHAKGMNNHMGSLATSSSKVIKVIVEELKKRKLFFIDSLTTGKSIAYYEAKNRGLSTGKRDVFIDSEEGYEYAVKQLKILMSIARRKGHAIGICHPKTTTFQALKSILPQMKKHGIELIRASEVVR